MSDSGPPDPMCSFSFLFFEPFMSSFDMIYLPPLEKRAFLTMAHRIHTQGGSKFHAIAANCKVSATFNDLEDRGATAKRKECCDPNRPAETQPQPKRVDKVLRHRKITGV
jgi:hypothetical protein